ncbi:MAG: LemA family protein [Bacteroidales bacterium]|nr:LemA family protein [Bacteroidales bacterium]
MKKSLVILLGVIGVVVLLFLWGVSVNNRLVTHDEAVSKAWSQVENVYQRRADLIPQLVNTVKGAANFEKSTFTEVVEARAKATSVNIDANNLSEQNVAAFQKAQDNLTSALGRALTVTVERYPELAATQAFRDLQTQLEGTENRIAVERRNFNEAVNAYNTTIRRFPTSLLAGMLGFDKKGYFTASEGADKPVQVEFDF